MFKFPSPVAGGVVVLSILLAGCSQHPPLPPVIGADEQAAARAAYEEFVAALDRGDRDKVWDGVSVRSQTRIKESGVKAGGEREKAVELARQVLGKQTKIKDVLGTRAGAIIGLEFPNGRYREVEMVSEDGAWKINLHSS